MYKNKCDYAVEWLVVWLGGVVWCGAVCCCRGVLVLGILKLEIGKIQGVASREPLKHLITLCGKFLVSRTVDKR